MAAAMITGLGLVSSHGQGRAVHAALLDGATPILDAARFAPHTIHPTPALPLGEAIPRREFRQMEGWQRLGVYGAGLAIDDAGRRDRVANMDLTIAAGGGERDTALDERVLAARPDDAGTHRMLMDGLRPTLFLAQLSNLLAGSISIVHGVGGSSRTLLGEEIAGAEALRVAALRVECGRSSLALTGAALVPERAELLLLYALGDQLLRAPWTPLPGRHGLALGAAAAFLTLEPEGAAAAPLARLTRVLTDQGAEAGRRARLAALIATAGGEDAMLISTASGAPAATADELSALPRTPDLFTSDLVGHSVEAAFPFGVAMGALAIAEGRARRVVVTGTGQRRGEAAALLEAP
jgi:3-oxoacyl-[acyl-carrier-protein] synthase II